MQRLLREGGGRLSDDIPPPSPEERAEAEAEAQEPPPDPELPLPGLAPPPGIARVTVRPKMDPEVERLRAAAGRDAARTGDDPRPVPLTGGIFGAPLNGLPEGERARDRTCPVTKRLPSPNVPVRERPLQRTSPSGSSGDFDVAVGAAGKQTILDLPAGMQRAHKEQTKNEQQQGDRNPGEAGGLCGWRLPRPRLRSALGVAETCFSHMRCRHAS